MGSFAILSFKNGQLQPFTIQDIYVPDGQFTGFVEAPSGLKEYLSSGKGMRLPDANWWPNFPDSAEQALYFIETTSKEQFQGVITFNLSLIEQLLALTGDIYLPDYNQTINQDNFAQIARADRDEFFAGSQEKANFLNHFLNIFKTRLIQTFQTQPQAFLSLLNNALTSKDIQIYSRDETIAQILQRRKLDGQMFDNGQALYYFLVESNVGINKANRQVTRQVDIALTAEAETINIYFQNGNQFPYINYQRLYTKRDTKLVQVLVNQQPVSLVDQKILSTQNGEWLEIGFLLAMLPGEESTVEIDLQSNVNLEQKKRLFVQKQSGLPAVQYTLHYQDQKQSIKLLSDQTIIFD